MFRNGKATSETEYRNGERHGYHKEYGPDGSLKKHLIYENGKVVKRIKDSWF